MRAAQCLLLPMLAAACGSPPGATVDGGTLDVESGGDGFVLDAPGVIDASATPDADLTPVVLANVSDPRYLTRDATHVYWIDLNDGVLRRVSKDGAGTVETIATGINGPKGLEIDDTHAYYSDYVGTPGSGLGGRVWAVRKDGTDPPLLLGTFPGGGPGDLTIDGPNVYVTCVPQNDIYTVPRAGGTATPIVTNSLHPFLAIEVEGDDLYFTTDTRDGMMAPIVGKMPKDGSAGAIILHSRPLPERPLDLSIAGGYAFVAWTSLGTAVGGVDAINVATGEVTVLAAGDEVWDSDADDLGAAWVEYTAPAGVWIVGPPPPKGPAPVQIADGYNQILGVTVDPDYVFFGTKAPNPATPGAIYRVSR